MASSLLIHPFWISGVHPALEAAGGLANAPTAAPTPAAFAPVEPFHPVFDGPPMPYKHAVRVAETLLPGQMSAPLAAYAAVVAVAASIVCMLDVQGALGCELYRCQPQPPDAFHTLRIVCTLWPWLNYDLLVDAGATLEDPEFIKHVDQLIHGATDKKAKNKNRFQLSEFAVNAYLDVLQVGPSFCN